MFRSRVQGVGTVLFVFDPGKTDWSKVIPQVPITRAQVCHPDSPAGTCKPVDWKPDAVSTPAPAPAPAKPTGSALPLLLGAAYLLLA
jgi:hypothetical protein